MSDEEELQENISEAVSLLEKEIGLEDALEIGTKAAFNAQKMNFEFPEGADRGDRNKVNLKNYFKLHGEMYKLLQEKYGSERAKEVMSNSIVTMAKGFFKGFAPIGPDDKLLDFAKVYKEFESNNLIFDIIKEDEKEIDYKVNRCAIHESMSELGMGELVTNLCGFAHLYFMGYHPKIKYLKDKAIGKGDPYCHEWFVWMD